MIQRVGLLTLPLSTNYGGILQAAALHEVLRSLSIDVVLLQRESPRSWVDNVDHALALLVPPWMLSSLVRNVINDSSRLGRLLRRVHHHRGILRNLRFIESHLPSRSGPLHSSAALREAVTAYSLDAVLVGSDQVWRPDYVPPGAVSDFFLGSVGPARRLSYAASFGFGEWRFPGHVAEVAECLRAFHAVSVREASGVDICRTVLGRDDAKHVLDPTILVDPSFYDRLAAPAQPSTGRLILEYVLDGGEGKTSIGHSLSRALGQNHSVRRLGIDHGANSVSVGEWLRGFMDADMVVTDSFHGVAFSIIFRKPFVAIVNESRGAERFVSLLQQVNLSCRLLRDPSIDEIIEVARQKVDYASTTIRLSALRTSSMDFLVQSLR